MTQVLVPVLYVLAGVCAYAAIYHTGVGWRRPLDRTQLLFAALSLFVACNVLAKLYAYQAETAQDLVAGRRWEVVFGLLVFAVLPWFVAEYTGVRQRLPRLALTLLFALLIAANLWLPYGVSFAAEPRVQPFVLPWGEQVVDLRVLNPTAWHRMGFPGLFVALGYGFYAGLLQYRGGQHQRAVQLTLALGIFLLAVLGNWLVNHGYLEFVHTAEFGFLALVILMNQALTREISRRDQRVQAVLDQVPAVAYVKDLEGRYLLSNRRHRELLSPRGSDVVGQKDEAFFTPAEIRVLRRNDREVVESGRALEFEEIVERDGQSRVLLSLKFPLIDAAGTTYGLGGISTDITEQRAAERDIESLRKQVWHAERVARMGALNASIAHELNQPLTAILSNAQAGARFLEQNRVDPAELREIFQDIARDTKRAGAVIGGLRDLLRRRELARETLDLAQVVGDVLALMHSEFVEGQVALETALAEGCRVRGNKAQLQQVIINLVQNAVESLQAVAPERRRLAVALARKGDQVRVTVRDNGPGIGPEHRDRIFTAFFTTKAHGLGLGLGVCQAIVESHGGGLQAEPCGDGGAVFSFTLPAAAVGTGLEDEAGRIQPGGME